jgi:hypothetical protein
VGRLALAAPLIETRGLLKGMVGKGRGGEHGQEVDSVVHLRRCSTSQQRRPALSG